MKILYRFMIKQFIGPFILIFLIVLFILLMQFLWKYVDELVGKGLDFGIIAEFLMYSTANLFTMAFPLAVLIASIFTMGTLGEHYELIALKSAGISLRRILFPLTIFSAIVAVCAFLFFNNVTPVANLQMRTLLDGIRKKRPELQIREGIFSNMLDGYSIRIGRKNFKTNQLYDLKIYDHTADAGNTTVIVADSGNMHVTPDKQFLELTLYNGQRYMDMLDKRKRATPSHPFSHQSFEKQTFRMSLPESGFERTDEERNKKGYQMMNLKQINYTVDSLSRLMETQHRQVCNIVRPAYNQRGSPSPAPPGDFMQVFEKQTKQQRLSNVQRAISDTRAQKDQLTGMVFEREAWDRYTRRYLIEWHRKITTALACIILFFIGAPLGAIIRKGGLGTPIIVAVLFFIIYYVISIIGEKSVRSGTMMPWEGMWLSTVIVLPVSAFLTYKATRDSSIFNPESYLGVFRKALNYIFVGTPASRDVQVKIADSERGPEYLLHAVEDLTCRCEEYSKSVLRQKKISIWRTSDDAALSAIGQAYDHVKTLLYHSETDFLRESADEYPTVHLSDFRVEHKMLNFVLIGRMKAFVRKRYLRDEIDGLIAANEKLLNELRSIV